MQVKLRFGGSGHQGMSYARTKMACPEKARLKKLAVKDEMVRGDSGVGTLVHVMLDLYHTRRHDALPRDINGFTEWLGIQYLTPDGKPAGVDLETELEACRLMRAYQEYVPADIFGRVIATEALIDHTHPKADAIAAAVGRRPDEYWSGILDLVCHLDTAACDRVEEIFNIRLMPGFYLVDHKTKKRRSAMLVEEYQASKQLKAYGLAWNALHSQAKLQGILVNVLFRLKKPDFCLIPVGVPGRVAKLELETYWRRLETMPEGPNTDACFTYGRRCEFWNVCKRF